MNQPRINRQVFNEGFAGGTLRELNNYLRVINCAGLDSMGRVFD